MVQTLYIKELAVNVIVSYRYLYILFSSSLSENKLPFQWKQAKVVANFKNLLAITGLLVSPVLYVHCKKKYLETNLSN